MKDKEMITISLEEYKELLVIKGKYLEKVNITYIPYHEYPNYPQISPSITWTCGTNTSGISTITNATDGKSSYVLGISDL